MTLLLHSVRTNNAKIPFLHFENRVNLWYCSRICLSPNILFIMSQLPSTITSFTCMHVCVLHIIDELFSFFKTVLTVDLRILSTKSRSMIMDKKSPLFLVRIQSVGGCAHMHCTLCDTRFFWICLGSLLSPQAVRPLNYLSLYHPQTYSCNHNKLYPQLHSPELFTQIPVILNVTTNSNINSFVSSRHHIEDQPFSLPVHIPSTCTKHGHQKVLVNASIHVVKANPYGPTQTPVQTFRRQYVCLHVRSATCTVAMTAAAVATTPAVTVVALVALSFLTRRLHYPTLST